MIKLKNIVKIYNPGTDSEVKALNNINLTIKEKDMIAIMGISGSGKSTLLHILGGLDTATSGEYLIDDSNIFKFSSNRIAEFRNKEIGFVLQDFGLILDKKVSENIGYPLIFNHKIKEKDIKAMSYAALQKVDLKYKFDMRCNQLSGGQKQRVAIARALVNNPRIILADEPTGALDTKTAKDIMDLFESLNNDGMTVIIVTHDINVAKRCKKIISISDGEITDIVDN